MNNSGVTVLGDICMGADDNGLRRSVARSIAFMRMAAIELRRIAERDPAIAGELRRIADQLDADADDLGRSAGSSSP